MNLQYVFIKIKDVYDSNCVKNCNTCFLSFQKKHQSNIGTYYYDVLLNHILFYDTDINKRH